LNIMGKEKELEFESYEDVARWFEESDMANYSKRLVPVEFTFDLRKKGTSLSWTVRLQGPFAFWQKSEMSPPKIWSMNS